MKQPSAYETKSSKLYPTIGIEIHVELKTLSKMFCGCPADHFGKKPNTQTCPVCLGLPGALPVPNKKAVEWTIMIGQALNCTINKQSKFDRKHYFYPDLPKGYQISQYDEPIASNGWLKVQNSNVKTQNKVGITRVHIEEDTGKLQHKTIKGKKVSLVDFNRGGVPLVEIVSEPEIHSAKQAGDYARQIRNIVQFLKVSDGDLEKGSLRLEANISWGLDLNYKVEVKNINSYRFLEAAIDYELKRQKALLEKGITPDQETRGWNEKKNITFSQRSKETAQDYRYFPEPDIPPMEFTPAQIKVIIKAMPKLPQDYHQAFVYEYKIRGDYALELIKHRKLAEKALACFKLAVKEDLKPKKVANFLINQKSKSQTMTPAQIVNKVKKDQMSATATDEEMVEWTEMTLASNTDLVTKYQSGKTQVIGALIGDVMKRSKGQANPQKVKSLLEQKLKS